MMAHVAEASEASGRVLFWTDRHAPLNPGAAKAASRLAAAFQAEIETVTVDAGDIGQSRDLSAAGFVARGVGAPELEAINGSQFDRAALAESLLMRRQQRDVAECARRYGVACRHTMASGDAIDVLAELCTVRGPWNVVVAAGASAVPLVGTLFANVSGATGVVVAPVGHTCGDGPIVVIAEDIERLPSMIRAAARLTRMFGRIHVLFAASTRAEFEALEARARLAIPAPTDVVFEKSEPSFGAEEVYDAQLRKLAPSFVVCRFGGTVLPTGRALSRTIAKTGAPFLLVR